MTICSLLSDANVIPLMQASDKHEAIEQLVSSLGGQVDQNDLSKIRQAVFDRESIMSTGVGKGLAIPHGKVPGLEQSFAAFATVSPAIEYDAIDKVPVSLIFLLVGPQSQSSSHIKMLSRISRLMTNSEFREKLLDYNKSGDIIEAFKSEESLCFDA